MKKLFSYDKFPKGRGEVSQNVEIKCVNCAQTLFNYKKKAHGVICELFFDLITGDFSRDNKSLICPNCEKLLGTKIVIGKERRTAFKLYPGSIYYKTISNRRPRQVPYGQNIS